MGKLAVVAGQRTTTTQRSRQAQPLFWAVHDKSRPRLTARWMQFPGSWRQRQRNATLVVSEAISSFSAQGSTKWNVACHGSVAATNGPYSGGRCSQGPARINVVLENPLCCTPVDPYPCVPPTTTFGVGPTGA